MRKYIIEKFIEKGEFDNESGKTASGSLIDVLRSLGMSPLEDIQGQIRQLEKLLQWRSMFYVNAEIPLINTFDEYKKDESLGFPKTLINPRVYTAFIEYYNTNKLYRDFPKYSNKNNISTRNIDNFVNNLNSIHNCVAAIQLNPILNYIINGKCLNNNKKKDTKDIFETISSFFAWNKIEVFYENENILEETKTKIIDAKKNIDKINIDDYVNNLDIETNQKIFFILYLNLFKYKYFEISINNKNDVLNKIEDVNMKNFISEIFNQINKTLFTFYTGTTEEKQSTLQIFWNNYCGVGYFGDNSKYGRFNDDLDALKKDYKKELKDLEQQFYDRLSKVNEIKGSVCIADDNIDGLVFLGGGSININKQCISGDAKLNDNKNINENSHIDDLDFKKNDDIYYNDEIIEKDNAFIAFFKKIGEWFKNIGKKEKFENKNNLGLYFLIILIVLISIIIIGIAIKNYNKNYIEKQNIKINF